MIKHTFFIEGMTCAHCEKTIEKTIRTFPGTDQIKAIASKNTVSFHYDKETVELADLAHAIHQAGYDVVSKPPNPLKQRLYTLTLMTIATLLVLRYGNSLTFDFLPNIRQNMGYGTLFIVGLLTSVHCLTMCGGINISQCQKTSATSPSGPSLLYNLGRLTSYTLIGGVIGGIGSVLSFTGQARGYVTLFVSAVMVMMAIKMLKLIDFGLPGLRLPFTLRRQLGKLAGKGPFFVGLANGFMPCGPLQSMQLYALGTGSILRGALSMFYFSLGTFPLMFLLGLMSSLMNHRFSKHILKYSGLLIFILGLTMFTRGAALAGIGLPMQYNGEAVAASIQADGEQEVRIHLKANAYDPIIVKRDVPVRFIIDANPEDMNGCNNPISIPSLNIEQTLYPGENVIEFTPTEGGRITYTCWMGMISSYIEVVE